MIFIAIDYGKKRIGIAKGDSETKIARPFCIIENKNYEYVLESLRKIIKDEWIDKIILGMPQSMKGEDTEQTAYTLDFKEQIKKDIPLEIIEIDERLTSKQAYKLFDDNQKRRIDDVAAMIMLQAYLDKKN